MSKRLATTAVSLAIGASALVAIPAAQASVRSCGYSSGFSVSVNSATSCPFGRNVAQKFRSGDHSPVVWSPVTHRYYHMHCYSVSRRSHVCRGGTNAYVKLTR